VAATTAACCLLACMCTCAPCTHVRVRGSFFPGSDALEDGCFLLLAVYEATCQRAKWANRGSQELELHAGSWAAVLPRERCVSECARVHRE
jgi:hypothetical protein